MTFSPQSRTIPVLLAVVSLCALLLFGCAQEPATTTEETATPPAAEPSMGGETTEPSEAPTTAQAEPSLLNPSSITEQAPEEYTARFETSKGVVRIQVTRSSAPLGADRFYALIKNGFYDGCRFFRVVPGFVVQFGLNGDPAINKVWREQQIRDDPVVRTNRRGTVTFATAGANTRTTQLFINLGANAFLDSQGFAPFGDVVEGMDVVESIYAGYGQEPDQGLITSQGNEYLEGQFPRLDYIETAAIE